MAIALGDTKSVGLMPNRDDSLDWEPARTLSTEVSLPEDDNDKSVRY